MKKTLLFSIALIGFLSLSNACHTEHEVKVAPVEVKPIHITIDVNVRIDRALDDFFGDIDQAEQILEESSNE